MMDISITVEPSLDSVLLQLAQVNTTMGNGIDNLVSKTALQLNVDAKYANPVKTGNSRRSWTAPSKIAPMVWKVSAGGEANYIPYIHYGKKKPSVFISAPKGISISGGDSFVGNLENNDKSIMKDDFDKLSDKLEQNILTFLEDLIK